MVNLSRYLVYFILECLVDLEVNTIQLSLSLTTFECQMFHLSWEIWFNYSELLKKH
jgi:hypothetical protein